MKNHITRNTVLGLILSVTIALVIGDLAFSVATYHDNIFFFLLPIWFLYCLKADLNQDRQQVYARFNHIFKSAKWLIIAFALYFVYDIITIFYTKNLNHALAKLPYMFEYLTICFIGIYYCSTKRRMLYVASAIGATGVIVAVGSYIYHMILIKPIYFQRLSTARDYNVYACLLFVCFVFLSHLVIHEFKFSFGKRILVYTLLTAVILPSFYFAGSRRMFIMLPWMFLFTLVYETVRLRSKLPRSLVFISIAVVLYLGTSSLLPAFTEYGSQKEAAYQAWEKEQQDTGIVLPQPPSSSNETTIGSMIETIEDKSMVNKRLLIYKTALKELTGYTPLQLIFGRGSAYDIHMYDITDEKDILDAYRILEYDVRPTGWMSAHNFMLADILNGGIIELLLGLFMIVQIFIHIVKAIKIKPEIGSAMIVIFALIVSNNFISGRYGMLNDVFFYVLLMVLIPIISLKEIKKVGTGA